MSLGPGHLDVFARGSSNQLVHRSYTSGAWTSVWAGLGGVRSDDPDASGWET